MEAHPKPQEEYASHLRPGCRSRIQGTPDLSLIHIYVVPENIVRIGDPESRRCVVGRDQDILGALPGRIEDRFALRSDRAEVCRNTGFAVRMTLGLHSQIVDELVARFDGVFQEVAVTHGVEGHVVFHSHVIGTMHRHACLLYTSIPARNKTGMQNMGAG